MTRLDRSEDPLLGELSKVLAYDFKDKDLIKTAITHTSFANEARGRVDHNERLEFLGDSVLSLSVSEFIYKTYPKLPEGSMTKLRAGVVSEFTLAKIAKSMGLGKYLRLGKGEQINGGRHRDSILADAFEAIIAAIYLDGGLEPAKEFVIRQLADSIKNLSKSDGSWDSKTLLQELLQVSNKADIRYEIIAEDGPDHNKSFTAQISNNGKIIGTGQGKSKKEAEQMAAYNALKKINEEEF
ncbi:MAG: ribonuclease III [Caldicoprobacterales bacterium]|jgi:ribonuclease-3|nr:ribonuclease III [Clostridia bacterium]MDI9512035.1 ribonuclease III [Bacillota bacterium]